MRELCVRMWTSRLINNREVKPLFQLSTDSDNSGLLANFKFRSEELPPLEPIEIELTVKASALNFRDIMVGLGRFPLLS